MPEVKEALKKIWGNQRVRTAVPIALCLLIAWLTGGFILFLLVALVVLVGQRECMGLFAKEAMGDTVLALVLGFLYVGAYALAPSLAFSFLTLAMLAMAIKYLFFWQQAEGLPRCHKSAAVLFSFMYVPFLLAPVLHFSPMAQLLVVLVPACSDIAAYTVGMRYGKTKIWPAVSPAKSVQGAVAGIAAAFVVGFAFLLTVKLFPTLAPAPGNSLEWNMGLFSYAAMGGCIGVFLGILAQLGDFFESALKRSAGVKDSGTLLPGHGGMLDRIDSTLFSVAGYTVLLAFVPNIL